MNSVMDRITAHPQFLDVAMRKYGIRMQQEHVSAQFYGFNSSTTKVKATMMRAVEVNGAKDPEVSNTDDIELLARTHGFPLKISSMVEEKFDDIVHAFMTEHFKSAIPVSLFR